MNAQEFEKVVEETIVSIRKLLEVKGGEYAGTEDRLSNFKRGAASTGCTPLQVAFIYAAKHWDSIASYTRNPNRPSSEPIEGRLDDLINYCLLIKGIIREARQPYSHFIAPPVFGPNPVYPNAFHEKYDDLGRPTL